MNVLAARDWTDLPLKDQIWALVLFVLIGLFLIGIGRLVYVMLSQRRSKRNRRD